MKDTNPTKSIQDYKFLSWIISIVFFAALARYIFINQGDIAQIKNIRIDYVIYIAILHNLQIILIGYLNQKILLKVNFNFDLKESIFLQYVNNLLNKVTPKGGGAFRAVYLKNKYDFAYTNFISTIAGYYVITIASQSIVGLACLSIIYFQSNNFDIFLTTAYIAVFIGSILAMLIKIGQPKSSNRIIGYFIKISNGWQKINDRKIDVIEFILISTLGVMIRAVQLYLIFTSLNVPVSFVSTILLGTLSIFLMVINITPDGLGLREIVYVFTATILPISGPVLALSSLILRIIEFLSALAFGSLSYWRLMSGLNRS